MRSEETITRRERLSNKNCGLIREHRQPASRMTFAYRQPIFLSKSKSILVVMLSSKYCIEQFMLPAPYVLQGVDVAIEGLRRKAKKQR